jgi:hypothetical protein
MHRLVFSHLKQHCVGYAALFVALGGTAYAAGALPPNSVGTAQVINHSLLALDFKAGQIPRGPAGPAGAGGTAKVTTVDGAAVTMCASGGGACQIQAATVTCPAGTVATGGGWVGSSPNLHVPVARAGGNVYGVIGVNLDTASSTIAAQAVCVTGTAAAPAAAAEAVRTALARPRATLAP